MGYHRPVSFWNKGKQSEHKERKYFREEATTNNHVVRFPSDMLKRMQEIPYNAYQGKLETPTITVEQLFTRY